MSNSIEPPEISVTVIYRFEGTIDAVPELEMSGHLLAKSGEFSQDWTGFTRLEKGDVSMGFSCDEGLIYASHDVTPTKRVWEFLDKRKIDSNTSIKPPFPIAQEMKWPDNLRKERIRLTEPLEKFIEQFHFQLKYKYDQYHMGEEPKLLQARFSINKNNKNIEYTSSDFDLPIQSFVLPEIDRWQPAHYKKLHVDSDMVSEIFDPITKNDAPLIAMPYLHRAINENDPRHKWIDATIAAELAIKEFLTRMKPDLDPVISELPSPPPHKLYGKVMEELFGIKSPVVKSIDKGADIRNKLVHSHKPPTVTRQQAEDYVKDIEFAILHLRHMLDPDCEWIADAYRAECERREK